MWVVGNKKKDASLVWLLSCLLPSQATVCKSVFASSFFRLKENNENDRQVRWWELWSM